MDCRQVEDLLLDYLEQELDSAGSAAVEEHLQGCSACRQYRDDLKSTLSELSQAGGSFATRSCVRFTAAGRVWSTKPSSNPPSAR